MSIGNVRILIEVILIAETIFTQAEYYRIKGNWYHNEKVHKNNL